MAETAREKLARIRAEEDATNKRGKSSWVAPPDYQDIIKAAQAEERASRSGANSNQSGDKWKGLREVTPKRNDSSERSVSNRNVPAPSSRSQAITDNARDAAPRNAPVPTARPSTSEGTSTDSDSNNGIVAGLIAAGVTAAAAYAMYKRAARGDQEAISDIKTVMSGQVEGNQPDQIANDKQAMIANRMGEPIDAEFEELPDQKQLETMDATRRRYTESPNAEREMANAVWQDDNYVPDGVRVGDPNIDAMIDEVDGLPSDPKQIAARARPSNPAANPNSGPTINVGPNGEPLLEGNYANMDAMIGKYLEEDDMPSPAMKSGRVTRDVRVKPKIKPKS